VENMKKKIFIEGMKCGNCANHVKEALNSVEGITSIEINLSDKYAVIDVTIEINDVVIKSAINSEKYKVVNIETV
jgi:copper chaperone